MWESINKKKPKEFTQILYKVAQFQYTLSEEKKSQNVQKKGNCNHDVSFSLCEVYKKNTEVKGYFFQSRSW